MSKKEVVKRVNSNYVWDNCVQVIFPYKDCITIMDENGIMYHSKKGASLYINKYLEDNRRFVFPYNNIPVHYSRTGIFGKNCNTNQILEFDKSYVRILDYDIIESFVVRDGNEALLIDKKITGNRRSEFKTREELELFFGNNKLDNEDIYFLLLDGSIFIDNDFKILHNLNILSEDDIFFNLKSQLEKNVNYFKNYIKNNPGTNIGNYFFENPLFLQFVEQQVDSFNISDINFSVLINQTSEPFLMIKTNGNGISIKSIKIYFIAKDKYRLDIVDIPVSKYTLEQLKYVSKISLIKEPKISLKLNPGITEIEKDIAKRKIKSIKS